MSDHDWMVLMVGYVIGALVFMAGCHLLGGRR